MPAGIAIVVAVVVWFMLPDTPPSVGLPEFAGTHVELPDTDQDRRRISSRVRLSASKYFCNKYIWLLSVANFFVYSMRYAVFDWGTTILKEAKHIEIADSKWMLAGFEVFGFIGAMLGGWLSDRFLGGRTARACVVLYGARGRLPVLLFWKIPARNQELLMATGLLCATGFFVYGPQCLLAIACANLATQRAAATAKVGLTSYFSVTPAPPLSGVGLGALVTITSAGTRASFASFCAAACIGTLPLHPRLAC